MIKEFLSAVFAPGKLMRAIDELRMENARLRHELRHYTEYTYQQLIEPYLADNQDYMRSLHRRGWQKIAGALAERGLFDGTVAPLSVPERGQPRPVPMEKKLVMRVLVRTPTPMLQGVVAPCEEDPDWVIEEYALKMREQDPPDLKRPFMRISLMKRLDLSDLGPGSHIDAQTCISRVATVRFERDGAPFVVSR